MSGGSLPPSYDATMGRGGPNAPSIISDQSLQSFQIRDPKLRESLKKCQINPKLLKVGDLIKEGNFGAVYKGILTNHGRQEQVAVKTLKVLDDTGAFEEFMKEGILTKGKKKLHLVWKYPNVEIIGLVLLNEVMTSRSFLALLGRPETSFC